MWNKKIGVREQAGEGHVSGLWEEGRSKTDGVAKDVKSGSSGVLRHSDDWKKLGEEIQGPVMHWEMFLPTTSLKVLLVESDDSARHVVSALLRNCCYEVIAAANGLEAWKILEDLQNHVDLVLTEIMMPYLSGFDLLCKIMNHKVLKNIPVLMMSSQDSMGIVFKCLSKGAVDFLVKPIRRNELKNLWQHVWRRCHSSNGSGSESGTQTKKSAKSKSNDDSENNSGSCNDNANGSISQSIRDGCDEGSGTQGSWTKGVAERDTSQVEDATDGTYAQVNYKKPEAYSGRWVCVSEADDCREENEHFDKVATRNDLEIGISRTPDSYHEDGLGKISINFRQKMLHKSSEIDNKAFDIGLIKGGNENLSDQVADVISTTSDCANPQVESRACEVLSCLSDISPVKDKIDDDSRELPSIELGLKRPKKAAGIGMNAHDDHNVLRHSDNSAFSRYNTSCFASQAPAGNVGSCSPLGNSSVATEPEMALNSASHSSGTAMNQQSNVSDTNTDVVSGTKHVTSNPASFSDKLESTSAFKSPHVSAFHPVQKQAIPGNASNVTNMVQSQSKGSHQEVQVHHHHHYHHYHHHVHEGSLPDQDDLMLKNMAEAAPNCGSSNIFSGPVEGNIENHSLNGNASGSNHGSNGQNESCNLLNNRATNGESGNIVVSGSNGSGDVGSRTGGNGTDEDRFLQREAALTKFRNKRKERCFEKKVRYQSRKKLAEQRPRVRGQFVRQMASETKAGQGAQGDVMLYGRDCCGR